MEIEQPTRRYFSAEQKFKIVKELLTTDSSLSEICKKYDISAGNFYRWQDLFFEGAQLRLSESKDRATKAELKQIESLEKETHRMKNVIAEIVSENITLKKTLGE